MAWSDGLGGDSMEDSATGGYPRRSDRGQQASCHRGRSTGSSPQPNFVVVPLHRPCRPRSAKGGRGEDGTYRLLVPNQVLPGCARSPGKRDRCCLPAPQDCRAKIPRLPSPPPRSHRPPPCAPHRIASRAAPPARRCRPCLAQRRPCARCPTAHRRDGLPPALLFAVRAFPSEHRRTATGFCHSTRCRPYRLTGLPPGHPSLPAQVERQLATFRRRLPHQHHQQTRSGPAASRPDPLASVAPSASVFLVLRRRPRRHARARPQRGSRSVAADALRTPQHPCRAPPRAPLEPRLHAYALVVTAGGSNHRRLRARRPPRSPPRQPLSPASPAAPPRRYREALASARCGQAFATSARCLRTGTSWF